MILRTSLIEQLTALRGDAPEALVDVVLDTVDLPGGALLRARPRCFDAVREAEALAGVHRPTPYWTMPWASGTALARAVAAVGPELAGRSVVELGCGLALPSVAAARAGAAVLATDAALEAVVYAAHNFALNQQLGDVAAVAWPDVAALGGPWDLVLAADVLYRAENAESLARVLPGLVAPGGEAWIADPGRGGCGDFLARLRPTHSVATEPQGDDVVIHRVRRRVGRRSGGQHGG